MKPKVKLDWPKHSKKVEKAIETLISEGYTLHMQVVINVDGMKKSLSVEKI